MPFLVEGILLAFLTICLRRTFNDIPLGGKILFDLRLKFVETKNLGVKDVMMRMIVFMEIMVARVNIMMMMIKLMMMMMMTKTAKMMMITMIMYILTMRRMVPMLFITVNFPKK